MSVRVDISNDGAVIGASSVAAPPRVFGDRRRETSAVGSHCAFGYSMRECVADQDVVDELTAALGNGG